MDPQRTGWALALSSLLGCGGISVSASDASFDGSSPDASAVLACVGGTLQCGDRCVAADVDPGNCGACGKKCGAGEVCSAGKCAAHCQAGYASCGAACANLQIDPKNCGGCGTTCGDVHGVATCANGTCGITCTDTHQSCDGNVGNGCETDVSTDAKNCGRCQHDCLGGACVGGRCQPVVLATQQTGAWAIALDATRVLWTTSGNGGQVRLCAKTGCANNPTTLAGATLAYQIATDGANVYWADAVAGAVKKCALGGCGGSPTVLATGQTGAGALAIDGTSVYWTNTTTGEVQKCALGGCGGAPTTLAISTYPTYLAADAASLYWTSLYGGVQKCALTGGSVTKLAPLGDNGITVDATNVYWLDKGGQLFKCAKGGCGGAPTVLVAGDEAIGLAVDATDVYWGGLVSPNVFRCGLGGCGGIPTVIASAQELPLGVAVDAIAVYWTNRRDGTIVKVAK